MQRVWGCLHLVRSEIELGKPCVLPGVSLRDNKYAHDLSLYHDIQC